jgi:cytochrome c biogenesis protein CcdA/glutaredoxin
VSDGVELIIFHGAGCPHCARALAFLDDLSSRQPLLDVVAYEVWHDEANRALFVATAAQHGIEARAVPTIFLGESVWVGFDSTVQSQIEESVAALVAGLPPPSDERTSVDVPFVGPVDVGDSSLVVATLVIGFVDGVNPCSLWVLSMLLALVLHSGSRSRIVVVGTVFLVVTSALYGLYMLGAYSALSYADKVVWIRLVVALVAGTFGLLHLKEYVTHSGLSVTIASDRKPGMYRRMRQLASPERSLPAVIGATAALAVGVSLAETPCTAGLPLLWTNLLAERQVSAAAAGLLFVIYLVVFLLDELVVFGLAVVTMRAFKVQQHHGRLLQLISGTLMVALAITMIVRPDTLESIAGTVVVFALAAAAICLVLLVDRVARQHAHRHQPGHRHVQFP